MSGQLIAGCRSPVRLARWYSAQCIAAAEYASDACGMALHARAALHGAPDLPPAQPRVLQPPASLPEISVCAAGERAGGLLKLLRGRS